MFLKHTKWGLIWALIIFILCSIPGTDIIDFSLWELINSDKLAHAFVFFVLGVLLISGFSRQYSSGLLMHYPIISTTLICIMYGGLLELWQGTMFEYRTADSLDFIANSFGSLLAIPGYRFLYYRGLA